MTNVSLDKPSPSEPSLWKKLATAVTIATALVLALAACSKSPDDELGEIDGVWRAADNSQYTFITAGAEKHAIAGGQLLGYPLEVLQSVKLVSYDADNDIFRLTFTPVANISTEEHARNMDTSGGPVPILLRKMWDQSHKSFDLVMTISDGRPQELDFVRKLEPEDLAKIPKTQARQQSAPKVSQSALAAPTKAQATSQSQASNSLVEPSGKYAYQDKGYNGDLTITHKSTTLYSLAVDTAEEGSGDQCQIGVDQELTIPVQYVGNSSSAIFDFSAPEKANCHVQIEVSSGRAKIVEEGCYGLCGMGGKFTGNYVLLHK